VEGLVRLKLAVPGIALIMIAGACANGQAGGLAEPGGTAEPAAWTEPEKYGFVLDSECGERALIGRFQVTVEKGLVVRAKGLDDSARRALMLRLADLVPTLGELEAEAATARSEGADVVEIERDLADAHPTKITIDESRNAVDDEACYTIEDYTIGLTGDPSPSASR
jgi:hypothetical protein